MPQKEKPIVFISYSHKDEKWKDKLRPHLEMYSDKIGLEVWNDRKINGGEFWFDEIKNAMARAKVAICLVSADFLSSQVHK